MADVIWSDNSLRDIEEIASYIERDSEYYANLIVSRIFEAGNKLDHFPRRGRKVPERNDPNIREVQIKPYRIIYRIDDAMIRIITVVHARRNVRTLLREIFKKRSK